MHRRTFLAQSALALAGTRSLLASSGDSGVIVKTGSGMLRGEAIGPVNVFRGVPFARPPVGSQRFRAPQAVEPWIGVRDATRFASAAVQPGNPTLAQSED